MKKVLLVLDMQNDFVHADGPSGKSPLGQQVVARKVLANTAQAIKKARAAGVKIGYVRVGFSPDYRECPPGSPVFGGLPKAGILKLGEWGSEVHADLAPQPGDLQVVKHRVSPFHQTSLDLQLKTLGIGKIFCCGVTTQAVVQATVREAHDRDYEVVVLDDCCAAHSAEEHANSMGSIGRFCTVTNSNEVQFNAN